MQRFSFSARTVISTFLILISVSTLARAQQVNPQDARSGLEAERARRAEAIMKVRTQYEMWRMSLPRYELPRRNASFYDSKLTPAQKKLLMPSEKDRAAYAGFLKRSNTGLVRVLPKGKYEFSETISADTNPEMVLPIRGGGSSFSFTEKTHQFGPWSEISLNEDKLFAGFAAESLGLMTILGDVPLDSVTVNTPGVQYLAGLKPPKKYAEAEEQRNLNFAGFKVGEFVYSSVVPVSLNTTYVLRSTIYKNEGRLVKFGREAIYLPHPNEYEGADLLIAFRIVRQEEDGGITILWKRLQKFKAQKLKDKPRMNRLK